LGNNLTSLEHHVSETGIIGHFINRCIGFSYLETNSCGKSNI